MYGASALPMICPYSWFSMTTMATCENEGTAAVALAPAECPRTFGSGFACRVRDAGETPRGGAGTAQAPARRTAAARQAPIAGSTLGRGRARRGVCTRVTMVWVSVRPAPRLMSRFCFDRVDRSRSRRECGCRRARGLPCSPPIRHDVPRHEQHDHREGPRAVVEVHREPDAQVQEDRAGHEEPGSSGPP